MGRCHETRSAQCLWQTSISGSRVACVLHFPLPWTRHFPAPPLVWEASVSSSFSSLSFITPTTSTFLPPSTSLHPSYWRTNHVCFLILTSSTRFFMHVLMTGRTDGPQVQGVQRSPFLQRYCGDFTIVVEVWLHRVDENTCSASGLTFQPFQQWDPSVDTDTSRALVVMIVNSRASCTDFDFSEASPLQLEAVSREDWHTRDTALKQIEGMGTRKYVLSIVDNDNEFRSRCESEYQLGTSGLQLMSKTWIFHHCFYWKSKFWHYCCHRWST